MFSSIKLFRSLKNFDRHCLKCYSQSIESVVTEKRQEVTLIGINRPDKRNCVDSQTAQQLVKAFNDFEADASSPVAILHGIGGTFCAGYDLKELSGIYKNQAKDLNDIVKRGPMVISFIGFLVN